MNIARILAAAGAAATVSSALVAQPFVVYIGGATLQENLFNARAGTNDDIDVDGDGLTTPFFNEFDELEADQLAENAPTDAASIANDYWVICYRAIGSVNGIQELLAFSDRPAILNDPELTGTLGQNGVYDVFVSSIQVVPSDMVSMGDDVLEFIASGESGPAIANREEVVIGGNTGTALYNSANAGGWPVRAADPANGDFSAVFTQDPGTGVTNDIAPSDVPSRWAARGPAAVGAAVNPEDPRNLPASAGYGGNDLFSTTKDGTPNASPNTNGSSNTLPDFSAFGRNTNTDAPDANTVFDNLITYAPIGYYVNPGLGLQQATIEELQHGYATGRFPNGFNATFITRDVGSGTRNGAMNSIGIDPSYGIGDNIGPRATSSTQDIIGPDYIPTNKGGSSRLDGTVINTRLGIGYSGLERAVNNGYITGSNPRLELLAIRNIGGSAYARPSLDNVLNNGIDGYRIGGPGTWVTLGDPEAEPVSAGGSANGNPAMPNPAAAAYINNITTSVESFEAAPSDILDTLFTPGQFIAQNFIPFPALSFTQSTIDPLSFSPNAVDPGVQAGLRAEIEAGTLADSAYEIFNTNATGENPNRTETDRGADGIAGTFDDGAGADGIPGNDDDGDGTFYAYSDGVPGGSNYLTVGGTPEGDGQGNPVSDRNALAGDFTFDGQRNLADVAGIVAAWYGYNGGLLWDGDGALGGDVALDAIPEILGDFNGDGNFGRIPTIGIDGITGFTIITGYDADFTDARFWADGLYIDANTGNLNRFAAFAEFDAQSDAQGLPQGGNFFGTVISSAASYEAGDSTADVAGSGTQARSQGQNAGVTPGWAPTGADGVVDSFDADYVSLNFGDWADLDQATQMDLSADMNGDLIVDIEDLCFVISDVLEVPFGDFDLDGVVDASERQVVVDAQGQTGLVGYLGGDLNGDGAVNQIDLDIADGLVDPCDSLEGDANGDGQVTIADVLFIIARFGDPAPSDADVNGDGMVTIADVLFTIARFGN